MRLDKNKIVKWVMLHLILVLVVGSMTAAEAATEIHYDFVEQAPSANWHNNDGPVPWGTASTAGNCLYTSGTMENGAYLDKILFTHPKHVAYGFMHGGYTLTVPPAELNPTLKATYGFVDYASAASTGIVFRITIIDNGNTTHLFQNYKQFTGNLIPKLSDSCLCKA